MTDLNMHLVVTEKGPIQNCYFTLAYSLDMGLEGQLDGLHYTFVYRDPDSNCAINSHPNTVGVTPSTEPRVASKHYQEWL